MWRLVESNVITMQWNQPCNVIVNVMELDNNYIIMFDYKVFAIVMVRILL